jgi:hypothetical protein
VYSSDSDSGSSSSSSGQPRHLKDNSSPRQQIRRCAIAYHHAHHTPHVTRHTSHVTRHTSHVTRHTSHVTRHTSQAASVPNDNIRLYSHVGRGCLQLPG